MLVIQCLENLLYNFPIESKIFFGEHASGDSISIQ